MVPYFSPGFLHIWPHCPLPSLVPSHPPITHKSGRWSRAHEYLQQMSSYINTQGCFIIRVLLFGLQANYCFLSCPLRSHLSLFLKLFAVAAGWAILRLWLTLTFLGAHLREIVSPHYSTCFSSNWLGFLCLGHSVATNFPQKLTNEKILLGNS